MSQQICKNCVKSKRECEGYKQPVVFRHPAGEYQPREYLNNPTHFAHTYGGGHQQGFLPPLAAADGSNHGYDPAWARSFPESETQGWTNGHQGHTNGFQPSSHHAAAGWSGSFMDTHRPEQIVGNIQNPARYNWQPSATPVDFSGPSPSSAASMHPLEGGYWSTIQSALPPHDAQYSFRPQYSEFPETCPPAPVFRPSSTRFHTGEIPAVANSIAVKHELISSGMPSIQPSFQYHTQLMYV